MHSWPGSAPNDPAVLCNAVFSTGSAFPGNMDRCSGCFFQHRSSSSTLLCWVSIPLCSALWGRTAARLCLTFTCFFQYQPLSPQGFRSLKDSATTRTYGRMRPWVRSNRSRSVQVRPVFLLITPCCRFICWRGLQVQIYSLISTCHKNLTLYD